MTGSTVKVRIAPSPTGYLHVGTARTAIFNYLYARHVNGKFVVRIEDTDVERSKPELIDPILDALKWLHLDSDEEVVYQSKRSDIYAEYLGKFIESGHAYYCFCSPDELKAEREKARAEKRSFIGYNRKCMRLSQEEVQDRIEAGEKPTVRVRIPDGTTTFVDIVSGSVTRSNDELEDFIIARSDGSVTYNFAVVVDDHDMGITHVIRGNDHITNTFKQIIVYKAFDFEVPTFGHVPLILHPSKRKISKSKGDKDVNEYQREGILPEAMVNYLSLLGWSPKTDQDIFDPEELIEIFDAGNINSANAVFDEEKLLAFNQTHIERQSDHDIAVLVAPMLVDAGLSTKYWLETRWEYLRAVIGLLKGRTRVLSDFVERGGYFFQFDGNYEEKAADKQFNSEASVRLEELANRFEKLQAFTAEEIEAVLSQYAEELGVKKGVLIHPTRLAVSGMSVGPGLYDMLSVLGQSIVIERMRQAVKYIGDNLQ